jgi:hypothetical protein
LSWIAERLGSPGNFIRRLNEEAMEASDAPFFQRQSVETKHVLGLWHGSTENSAVEKAMFNDLRERELNLNRRALARFRAD